MDAGTPTERAMAESNKEWMTRKLFDEHSLQFRTVWDMYLKFYTVMLTINVAALALTVEKVQDRSHRIPIMLAFVSQHILSFITAVRVAAYSRDVAGKAREVAQFLLRDEAE